jgi:hypothetical protein
VERQVPVRVRYLDVGLLFNLNVDALAGAAEYSGLASGTTAGTVSPGAPSALDRLPTELLSDPIILVVAVASLLVVVGLLRTRRYRL